MTVGAALLLALPILLLLRVPVAIALLTAGGVGYCLLNGWLPFLHYLKTMPLNKFSSHSLSVIPMFILMGRLAFNSFLGRDLFDAAQALLGRFRGGVGMAAIGGCAAFGSICGSSLATASTMAELALPEMKRFGYSGGVATGILAAGGTLGILIPPSIVLIIYAILTEQNIAKMFLAAVIPGLLAATLYMLAIFIWARRRWPRALPHSLSRRRQLATLARAHHALWLFMIVMGGIYSGWFTPTEAASIGVVYTLVLFFCRCGWQWRELQRSLLATAKFSAMIFLILLGAEILNSALALAGMPEAIANWAAALEWPPLVVVGLILLLFLGLGCILDSLSMVLLTVPLLFPVVIGLDLAMPADDVAIWFGILVLGVVEVGLITPPFGLNVFVINHLAPQVPLRDTFVGVLPFLAMDLLRILLLLAFPALSLALL